MIAYTRKFRYISSLSGLRANHACTLTLPLLPRMKIVVPLAPAIKAVSPLLCDYNSGIRAGYNATAARFGRNFRWGGLRAS